MYIKGSTGHLDTWLSLFLLVAAAYLLYVAYTHTFIYSHHPHPAHKATTIS